MSSTRAASAASSRRVKQRLVQLLFGPAYSKKGREAHKLLDHTSYSYADLKRAFLERVHDIHPDKHAHKKDNLRSPSSLDIENDEGIDKSLRERHEHFIALQEAWTDYQNMAKMMKRVGKGDSDASFTMFGVGCSFADSDIERQLRGEIMDQAGRGWFSAGLISEQISPQDQVGDELTSAQPLGLCDDDMFVADDECKGEVNEMTSPSDAGTTPKRRKSLVDHALPRARVPPSSG